MNISLEEARKLRSGRTPSRLRSWLGAPPKAAPMRRSPKAAKPPPSRKQAPPGSSAQLQSIILKALAKGPMSATEICALHGGIYRGPVLYALGQLRTAGSVRREGEKRHARYALVRP